MMCSYVHSFFNFQMCDLITLLSFMPFTWVGIQRYPQYALLCMHNPIQISKVEIALPQVEIAHV
jgi:hypothetical protein